MHREKKTGILTASPLIKLFKSKDANAVIDFSF
jgi:hypothetical protein